MMKTKNRILSTLLFVAACMTTNAFAGSGANTVGEAKIVNQLSKNLRVATSCQGLGQWQALNVAANKSGTTFVASGGASVIYVDVPEFANCIKVTAHDGKTYKFYDDHGKLNYSEK